MRYTKKDAERAVKTAERAALQAGVPVGDGLVLIPGSSTYGQPYQLARVGENGREPILSLGGTASETVRTLNAITWAWVQVEP